MIFNWIAKIIYKYRWFLIVLITTFSFFSLWYAFKIQPSYENKNILPDKDINSKIYQQFKKDFGSDSNIVLIGTKQANIFDPQFIRAWSLLNQEIRSLNGVIETFSITQFIYIKKKEGEKRFEFIPYSLDPKSDKEDIHFVSQYFKNQPFYQNVLLDKKNQSTLISIALNKETHLSKKRKILLDAIEEKIQSFIKQHKTPVYISGIPYTKSKITDFVLEEFILFLSITFLVAALLLLFLYKNIFSVALPIATVMGGVVWTMAIMVLLDYKLTLLTGLIPPLLVIIGIPNSILIINKYLLENSKGVGGKAKLINTLKSTCFSTFLANFTTAIGFFVFYFTDSSLLKEFGLIAAVGVILTWLFSLVYIPALYDYFFYLKSGTKKRIYNTNPSFFQRLLADCEKLSASYQKRKVVFGVVGVLFILSLGGVYRFEINNYMLEDLSAKNPIVKNFQFFEQEFQGIIPLEIVVDSKKKRGVESLIFIKKIDRFNRSLSELDYVESNFSLSKTIKFATQSFYGQSKHFRIPSPHEKSVLFKYINNSKDDNNWLKGFVDPSNQKTRLSFRIKDIGSKKAKDLLKHIDSLAKDNFKNYSYVVTGSGIIYYKASKYLLKNLLESLMLAIVIIALLMWYFYKDIRMVFVATLPNLLPLLITAGIMGWFNIALKPSTLLVFSIALGIASDQTIYLLSKIKLLKNHPNAIQMSIKEMGVSMGHITLLLILGFVVFLFSDFKSTFYMGLLISLTLLFSFFSNILFLPSLLRGLKMKV